MITPSLTLRIFSAFSILYASWVYAIGFGYDVLPDFMMKIGQGDDLIAYLFITSIVFFLPFGITFTKLGLNDGAGDDPTGEIKRRHKELAKVCPAWKFIWYGIMGSILFSWVIAPLVNLKFNPFAAFIGGISLMSGLWFLFIYHKAVDLFYEKEDPAE